MEERFKELSEPLQYSESKQKKLFEKCMGLEFRLTEDHAVSLVYTNINPDNDQQKFTITLDIEDNNWTGMCEAHSVHHLLLQYHVLHNYL